MGKPVIRWFQDRMRQSPGDRCPSFSSIIFYALTYETVLLDNGKIPEGWAGLFVTNVIDRRNPGFV